MATDLKSSDAGTVTTIQNDASAARIRFPAIQRILLRLWSLAYLMCETEHAFCRRLPKFLKANIPTWPIDDTVTVDVGASVGVYAQAFSAWSPVNLAIEPNAEVAAHLRTLELPRTKVIAAAAGAAEGTAKLVDQGTRWRRPEARLGQNGAWAQDCDVVQLDEVVPTSNALVCKIDVEGSEAAVLQGMEALLARPFVMLIIELETRHNPEAVAVFADLEDKGFESFIVKGCRFSPVGPDHIRANENRRAGRFAHLNGYRPNIVFLRTSGD